MAKNRNGNKAKTEAQAFLDESAKDDSQACDVSEGEGKEASADQAASEPSQAVKADAPKPEEVKKADVKADKYADLPRKFHKFV